jgi:hypothetical protein
VDAEEEGVDGHVGVEEEEVGDVVVALEDVVTSVLELKPTAAIVILAVMLRITILHSTMPSLKNITSLRLTIYKIKSH